MIQLPKKKENSHYQAPNFSKYGTCEICKKEGYISEHHILKRIIFGDTKKTGHVCEECHKKIDASIKIFEAEILNKFSEINILIWNLYVENEEAPPEIIRKKVEKKFEIVRKQSFRIKRKLSTERKATRESLSEKQRDILNQKICPVCGNKKRNLTIHHIKKWVIFKDNRMLGFPCRECHNRIENSITLFEAEVLQHFKTSYRYIWDIYQQKGNMSDTIVESFAKEQFIQVQNKLFRESIKYWEKVRMKKIVRQRNAGSNMIPKQMIIA
ncbi:MAG: hypothetical protein PHR47_04245 [Candidatus Pacebacteria bacterium]|nr:hypothetical protein [Candidatus Paceibacterota bacterium]